VSLGRDSAYFNWILCCCGCKPVRCIASVCPLRLTDGWTKGCSLCTVHSQSLIPTLCPCCDD
jgi:hypothetical protein